MIEQYTSELIAIEERLASLDNDRDDELLHSPHAAVVAFARSSSSSKRRGDVELSSSSDDDDAAKIDSAEGSSERKSSRGNSNKSSSASRRRRAHASPSANTSSASTTSTAAAVADDAQQSMEAERIVCDMCGSLFTHDERRARWVFTPSIEGGARLTVCAKCTRVARTLPGARSINGLAEASVDLHTHAAPAASLTASDERDIAPGEKPDPILFQLRHVMSIGPDTPKRYDDQS